MNIVTIAGVSIFYDTLQTERCPIMLTEQVYIEDKKLPRYFIGDTTMTFFDFYHADSPDFQETDYQLSEQFKQIIGRFPHTNQQKIMLNEGGSYSIKHVPIYILVKDILLAEIMPETYQAFRKNLQGIQSLTPVYEEEFAEFSGYKRKRLCLDGTYGSRELLESSQERIVQRVQDKLEYVNEMYYFAHYNYAGMVQFLPEHEINTYDQFHEAYGKYIYSFTATKNGQTIPLLWPDYLYHKPENHLEFGLLAHTEQARYQVFDQWEKGEEVRIEILADGFEDVRFTTQLKQPMSATPKLSKSEYTYGEMIRLSIDLGLIDELKQQVPSFEVFKTKKISENGYSLHYELTEEQLLLPSEQFEKAGRYQLKIISERYGQLLFLFTIK
ncbi:hypothetical protein A5881_000398 [Enterococcus termitis]|nr:hypothetical protein A5881_000606 [Enterococcus termitis]